VVAGTTSDKQQPPSPPDHWQIRLQTTQNDRAGIKVDTTSHGVDNRFWLFVDFLLHKVVVLPLHDFGEFDLQVLNSSDGRETVVSSESVDVEFWK
jgi:hypothetical protein